MFGLSSINIHPLLVHFPLGLLTVYAVLEIIHIRLLKNPTITAIKAFLVIVGFIAACATWLSGQLIEHSNLASLAHPELVEIHSKFALSSTLVFGVLAAAYAVALAKDLPWKFLQQLASLFSPLSQAVLGTWVAPTLAALGLGLLIITGGLGGIIVYGPQLDPFTNLIYRLFQG